MSEIYVEDKKSWRISFTFPIINNARDLVFLVSGKDKQPVISAVLSKDQKHLPVQMIKPKGSCWWFIDEQANPEQKAV